MTTEDYWNKVRARQSEVLAAVFPPELTPDNARALWRHMRDLIVSAAQLPPPCAPGLAHVDLDELRQCVDLLQRLERLK